jgi:hypothetical protein
MGGDATVRELCNLAKDHGAKNLARTLGFDRCFAVSNLGRSGGLGMFWKNNISFTILPYSQYPIDAVLSEVGKDPWRVTGVSREAETSEQFKTWDMLKFIRSSSPLPCVCLGDFNKVLYQHEHVGVQERSLAQIAGFC